MLGSLKDDLAESVKTMIEAAVANDTPDNVTSVIIRFRTEDVDDSIKQVTDVMGRVFLFSSLTEQHRLVIAPYLEEVFYDAGDSDQKLDENRGRMIESCQRFIDFDHLESHVFSHYLLAE